MSARLTLAFAPPVRETRFLVRKLQRVEIPIEPGEYEWRIRFAGQRSFIRATRLQAEQAIASQLGEVRADLIVQKTELVG